MGYINNFVHELIIYDKTANNQLDVSQSSFSYETNRYLILSADDCDDVCLLPRAAGKITINGEEVKTGENYKIEIDEVNVPTDFTVKVEQEGRTPAECTVTFIKTPVIFDDDTAVIYDEDKYEVNLDGGNTLTITVTENENGELVADCGTDVVLSLKSESQPETTAPQTSAPKTTAPQTTAPESSAPEDSGNLTTGVQTSVPTLVVISLAAVCAAAAVKISENRKNNGKKR